MKKMNNKRGFTLAELLIVVAIIAVLVAVSIPIFNSQLEKSRESTDLANIRAAYAEGTAALIDGSYETDTNWGTFTAGTTTTMKAFYDTGTGKVTQTAPAVAGKGTKTVGNSANALKIGGYTYVPGDAYTTNNIIVTLDLTKMECTISWGTSLS